MNPSERTSFGPVGASKTDLQHSGNDPVRLRRMRDNLRDLLGGRRCLVVGSAPNAIYPQAVAAERVVCVNGSIRTAYQLGASPPNLTVISSRVTRPDNLVRNATLDTFSGLTTDSIMLIDVANEAERARQVIDEAGLDYRSFDCINPFERAAITLEACGTDLCPAGPSQGRVSNGIFTIALVLWSEAEEVILTGFSLSGGHSYIASPTKRAHADMDRLFFESARDRNWRVTTTSEELSKEFGLRVIR